jgi:phospholipid/cholesterol/gamma-HCH transport system substrate-binding protein
MTDIRKAIGRYLRHVLALVGMFLLATVIGAYIATNQRFRWPWQDPFTIEAEFENAQSVTPGQGQTVTVAGVEVGEIADVRLENGRAVVKLDIEEEDELGPIYRNAKMLLRPKTGLNDMSIMLDPGRPDPSLPDEGRLQEGDRLPIENTAPHVNPDQVLSALDTDTRHYLAVLLNAGGGGLRGRGPDLRELLRASQPTFSQTRRVMRSVADRRAKVRRLVSNLRKIAGAAATKDEELAGLVDATAAVVDTLGERDAELHDTLGRLPGTLGATRTALRDARGLAVELAPAAERLRPVARELSSALVDVRPLLRDATPVLRDDVRPLVRSAIPLVRELRPSVNDLLRSAPPLVRVARTVNYLANELGYNPPGPEEGYGFWTAWFAHNANSILSIEDAHGVAWRGLAMVGCTTGGVALTANPALAPLANLPICPGATVPGGAAAKRGRSERGGGKRLARPEGGGR